MRTVNTYPSLYFYFFIVLLNCYQGIIALQDFSVVASLKIHLSGISLLVFLHSGSGSFSLPGSADLFLGVPPVNGEQSAYPMGMQVLHTNTELDAKNKQEFKKRHVKIN